jgi:hypothetical protein
VHAAAEVRCKSKSTGGSSVERETSKKSARCTKLDFHAAHLGPEESKSASLTSASTTSEKKSFGRTVKGSSAIVLTPDSIVYNDNGIWCRFRESPFPG